MRTLDTKTIAISRTDGIGDVILTLPLCGIIKKNYPNSNLLFFGSSYTKDIITLNNDVDSFIDYTNLLTLNKKEQIEYLKSLKIDIILFIFPNRYLSCLCKKAKIKTRIATSHRIYNLLYCNKLINFSRKNSFLHEAQLNTFLLSPFIQNKDYSKEELFNFIHFIKPKTDSTIKNKLSNTSFNLIIHPKSKGSAREWTMDNYNKMITFLDKDIKIFVCGTENEGKSINIEGENVTILTGTMSLKEYIEFISLSDCLVACSTGPLHLAGILNINAVGLFAPMKSINPQRWQPLGNKVKIFCKDKPLCNDCKKNSPCKCINDITPQEVASYINNLNRNKNN